MVEQYEDIILEIVMKSGSSFKSKISPSDTVFSNLIEAMSSAEGGKEVQIFNLELLEEDSSVIFRGQDILLIKTKPRVYFESEQNSTPFGYRNEEKVKESKIEPINSIWFRIDQFIPECENSIVDSYFARSKNKYSRVKNNSEQFFELDYQYNSDIALLEGVLRNAIISNSQIIFKELDIGAIVCEYQFEFLALEVNDYIGPASINTSDSHRQCLFNFIFFATNGVEESKSLFRIFDANLDDGNMTPRSIAIETRVDTNSAYFFPANTIYQVTPHARSSGLFIIRGRAVVPK